MSVILHQRLIDKKFFIQIVINAQGEIQVFSNATLIVYHGIPSRSALEAASLRRAIIVLSRMEMRLSFPHGYPRLECLPRLRGGFGMWEPPIGFFDDYVEPKHPQPYTFPSLDSILSNATVNKTLRCITSAAKFFPNPMVSTAAGIADDYLKDLVVKKELAAWNKMLTQKLDLALLGHIVNGIGIFSGLIMQSMHYRALKKHLVALRKDLQDFRAQNMAQFNELKRMMEQYHGEVMSQLLEGFASTHLQIEDLRAQIAEHFYDVKRQLDNIEHLLRQTGIDVLLQDFNTAIAIMESGVNFTPESYQRMQQERVIPWITTHSSAVTLTGAAYPDPKSMTSIEIIRIFKERPLSENIGFLAKLYGYRGVHEIPDYFIYAQAVDMYLNLREEFTAPEYEQLFNDKHKRTVETMLAKGREAWLFSIKLQSDPDFWHKKIQTYQDSIEEIGKLYLEFDPQQGELAQIAIQNPAAFADFDAAYYQLIAFTAVAFNYTVQACPLLQLLVMPNAKSIYRLFDSSAIVEFLAKNATISAQEKRIMVAYFLTELQLNLEIYAAIIHYHVREAVKTKQFECIGEISLSLNRLKKLALEKQYLTEEEFQEDDFKTPDAANFVQPLSHSGYSKDNFYHLIKFNNILLLNARLKSAKASDVRQERYLCKLTPLHYAAIYGNIDSMVALVGHSADVNATDIFGNTPLHLVAYNKDQLAPELYQKVVDYLVKTLHVDANQRNKWGKRFADIDGDLQLAVANPANLALCRTGKIVKLATTLTGSNAKQPFFLDDYVLYVERDRRTLAVFDAQAMKPVAALAKGFQLPLAQCHIHYHLKDNTLWLLNYVLNPPSKVMFTQINLMSGASRQLTFTIPGVGSHYSGDNEASVDYFDVWQDKLIVAQHITAGFKRSILILDSQKDNTILSEIKIIEKNSWPHLEVTQLKVFGDYLLVNLGTPGAGGSPGVISWKETPRVMIIDLNSQKIITTITHYGNRAFTYNNIILDDKNDCFFACNANRGISAWDCRTGNVIREFPLGIDMTDFSARPMFYLNAPYNRLIVYAIHRCQADGDIYIFDSVSGAQISKSKISLSKKHVTGGNDPGDKYKYGGILNGELLLQFVFTGGSQVTMDMIQFYDANTGQAVNNVAAWRQVNGLRYPHNIIDCGKNNFILMTDVPGIPDKVLDFWHISSS